MLLPSSSELESTHYCCLTRARALAATHWSIIGRDWRDIIIEFLSPLWRRTQSIIQQILCKEKKSRQNMDTFDQEKVDTEAWNNNKISQSTLSEGFHWSCLQALPPSLPLMKMNIQGKEFLLSLQEIARIFAIKTWHWLLGASTYTLYNLGT